MFKFLLICVAMGTFSSEAAHRSKRRYGSTGAYAGGGAYAGSGAYAGNNGYGGGYTGTYSGDSDDYDVGGYAPDYGFIDPYLFHQQLTAQILAQQAAQAHAITSTFSSGNAQVSADASTAGYLDTIQIQEQIAQQQAYFGHNRYPQYHNNRGYKHNRYAPNYAGASASIGPGGYYQTAFINPENPNTPNIHNRFGANPHVGGYKGVSVSSFSSTSDIDGKRTSNRGAQTTINDNGKITTYKVHS